MTITTTVPAGAERRVSRASRCDAALIVGLAGVFLVNAVIAAVQPSDFTNLVERSALGRLAPFTADGWMAAVIGVNDLLLGLFLVASVWSPRSRPFVLAWTATWLLAVTVIKVTSLHAFGG